MDLPLSWKGNQINKGRSNPRKAQNAIRPLARLSASRQTIIRHVFDGQRYGTNSSFRPTHLALVGGLWRHLVMATIKAGQRLPFRGRSYSTTHMESDVISRGTIGDWYADGEMRGSSDPGRDWENDDVPDRTPDSWLDDLGIASPAHSPGGGGGEARRSGTGGAPHRPGTSCQCMPCNARLGEVAGDPGVSLAAAARKLLSTMPGAKDSTLARHLRRSGWPDVTADQVGRVLQGLNRQQPQRRPAPAKKNPVRSQRLADAAKAAQGKHPRLGIEPFSS